MKFRSVQFYYYNGFRWYRARCNFIQRYYRCSPQYSSRSRNHTLM